MWRSSQNYPNITSAQCCSSWLAGPAGSCSASHWHSLVVSGPGSPSYALLAGSATFLVTTVLFPLSSPSFGQKSQVLHSYVTDKLLAPCMCPNPLDSH